MTWIRTIPYEQAGPELRRVYEMIGSLYPPEYGGGPAAALVRADGSSDSIVSAHSLIPEAMRHMLAGFAALLRPELPLTRRQQEMITTVVSARNRCFH
jgi:hypothetical protein